MRALKGKTDGDGRKEGRRARICPSSSGPALSAAVERPDERTQLPIRRQ